MRICELGQSDKYVQFYIVWLKIALFLVFCMVLIGGLTRLTESGLSIVEWKLVSGTLPPLTTEGWIQEFEEYKATPEFIKKNNFMELQDFKQIYWLEYLHRLLGRVIGLVFLVPVIFSLVKRGMPAPLQKRSWLLFGMVCFQGVVGWYMVKSGLSNNPWVSPYRLAFHLLVATSILGLLYWSYMQLTYARPEQKLQGRTILFLIAIQIAFGAFVAGTHAGYTYNTFPLMDGAFFPKEMWRLSPAIRNVFEYVPTVQFVHRWFAFAVFSILCWQWMKRFEMDALYVLIVALVQIVLGVMTLLSVVDITVASVHQLVAMLLVVMQLRYMYRRTLPVTLPDNQKMVGRRAVI